MQANQNPLSEKCREVSALLDALELSESQKSAVLVCLEAAMRNDVIDDLMHEMQPEKKKQLNELLKTNPSDEKVAELLGVTKEEIEQRACEKLNSYIANLKTYSQKQT